MNKNSAEKGKFFGCFRYGIIVYQRFINNYPLLKGYPQIK